TIIWEKADSPLFASSTSFSTNQRLRLITDSESNQVGAFKEHLPPSFRKLTQDNRTKRPLETPSHPAGHAATSGSERLIKRQKWDLVIDFLRLSDADIYTCRLVGRTRQFIRYRLHVT
ncbi:hypothetical protein CRM22_011239, partial [Opisthorchis felineus]